MVKDKYNFLFCVFLCLLGLFIFTRGLETLGLEYRDDEIFYFQSTQEMRENQDYLSPTYFGENRFQKPILFYWLVLLSYKIFGVSWFSARFMSALFGSFTLVLLWLFAKELFTRKVAYLSVVILMTVPLFVRHVKNVVPDSMLNFFIVLAIYFGYRQIALYPQINFSLPKNQCKEKKQCLKKAYIFNFLFFVSCSLGFMVKGFAAFIIPVLTLFCYSLLTNKVKIFFKGKVFWNLLGVGVIILPWFIYMIKRHGSDYLEYMLVKETHSRIFGDSSYSSLLSWFQSYLGHFLFYFRVILSYFAPWSLFFACAVPFCLYQIGIYSRRKESGCLIGERGEICFPNSSGPFLFLFSWVGVALVFFSSLYSIINHYMLVICVPFAMIVSYFLCYDFNKDKRFSRWMVVCRKYALIFIFSFGFLAFSFLYFFLTKGNKFLLPVFILFFVFAVIRMFVATNYARAMILGVFIIFVMSQSTLLNEAHLTFHSVLSKFAEVIKEDNPNDEFWVAVGSHDLHEKEFQVYFDKKIDKISVSWEWGMQDSLTEYFSKKQKIYCLILSSDYEKYLRHASGLENIEILKEDFVFRRRLNINSEFFKALLRFEQERIYDFLMEKVLLIKKEAHAQ